MNINIKVVEMAKTFKVEGYLIKLQRPFKKIIEAESAKHAIDKVYCLFGSHNRLKRTLIKIDKIEEIKDDKNG